MTAVRTGLTTFPLHIPASKIAWLKIGDAFHCFGTSKGYRATILVMDARAGRFTKKAWFGPKKYVGWGWRILSWKGAVASAAFVALIVVSGIAFRGSVAGALIVVGLIGAFLVVAWLTGTPPGGPSSDQSSTPAPPTNG